MSGERCPVRWVGQAAVVSLPEEIDISNVGQIREDLLSIINRGAVLLVVDMSTTTFCDSAGVNALVRAFKRATASGTVMRLVAAPAVQRVLAITGVDHLIDIYPGVAVAMAAVDHIGPRETTHPRYTITHRGDADSDGCVARPG